MKFALGVIIGAIAASLFWYVSTPEAEVTSQTHELDPSQTSATKSVSSPTVPQRTAIVAADVSSIAARPDEPAQPEPPAPLPAQTDQRTSTVPVPTSHEHEELIKRSSARKTMAELHRDLELEEIDPDWAPTMESLISEYLLAHDFVEAFSINHITCKSSLCEIQAFGYEGHQQWNTMMSQMRSNDWYREFNGTSISSTSNDGKATVVTVLHRNLEGELDGA